MNLKKFTRTCALVGAASILMTTPAFAKDGPEDWYDSYESMSKYDVGDDIDPGIYCFFNKSDTNNASITIKRDGDRIWSESFWHNYIVEVEDGDIITAANTYCIPYDEVEDFSIVSSEEGFFEVGTEGQIRPGTYDVEFVRGEDGEGFIRVWSDLVYMDNADYKDYQVESSVSRGKEHEVTLEEGWYVELKGCRLVHHTED